MLKDRGTIKWTSLMLPEHVELLQEMWEETEKINKPILDPQELEQLNKQLIQAYNENFSIAISIYENGSIKKIHGTIKSLCPDQNQIHLQVQNDMEKIVNFDHVISVKNST